MQRPPAATVLGVVRGQYQHPRLAARRHAGRVSRPGDLAGHHRGDPRRRRLLCGGRHHLHRRPSRPCAQPDAVPRHLRCARQYRPDPGVADVAPGLGNRQHHHGGLCAAVVVLDPVRLAGRSQKRTGAHPGLHRHLRAADLIGIRAGPRHLAGDPEVGHLRVRRVEHPGRRLPLRHDRLECGVQRYPGTVERDDHRHRHHGRWHGYRLGQRRRGHVALPAPQRQGGAPGGVGSIRCGHSAGAVDHPRRPVVGGQQRPGFGHRPDRRDPRHAAPGWPCRT